MNSFTYLIYLFGLIAIAQSSNSLESINAIEPSDLDKAIFVPDEHVVSCIMIFKRVMISMY